MKQTLLGMIEAGEPLMRQAIEAMRHYHEAETTGCDSVEEVERLRVLAESLFQAVSEYRKRPANSPFELQH